MPLSETKTHKVNMRLVKASIQAEKAEKERTKEIPKVPALRHEESKEQLEETAGAGQFVSTTICPNVIRPHLGAHARKEGMYALKLTVSRITSSVSHTKMSCLAQQMTDLDQISQVSQRQTASFWSCLQVQVG